MKNSAIRVTDHAVVRYLQRVMGVDVTALREKIMPPASGKRVKELGNGQYPIEGGGFSVVVDGAVVTVTDKKHSHVAHDEYCERRTRRRL